LICSNIFSVYNLKISNYDFYAAINYVVSLTELSNSPSYSQKSEMGLHIIVLLGGVPLGVITNDDPEYWSAGVDQ
jgi:hypothetical protein